MRKFMLLLLGALLVSVPVFAAESPANEGATIQDLVKGGPQDTGVRIYARVRNSSQAANEASLVAGDAVVWDSVSDDGYSVTKVFASADNLFAGIIVTTIPTDDTGGTSDVGGRNWGYAQVYGIGSANSTAGGSNAANVGEPFITSGDDGKITSANASDATNAAVLGSRGGFYLDAGDGSSTSYDVFIKSM